MNVLGATTPLNLESERARWEADMHNYNPQLRYKDDEAALAATRKVKASSSLLHIAVGIMERVIGKYGSER